MVADDTLWRPLKGGPHSPDHLALLVFGVSLLLCLAGTHIVYFPGLVVLYLSFVNLCSPIRSRFGSFVSQYHN